MRRLLLACALLPVPCAVWAGASPDRQLIGQLDREVIALKQKVRYLEDRIAGCAAGTDPAPIYGELVQVFAGSPVAVARNGALTTVTLPGDIVFGSGGVSVRDESRALLDLLAMALKLHEDITVTLVGHTDTEPPPRALLKSYPTNWELSSARALAVARALAEQHGVAWSRFTVAGRADLEPITGNDTPEGRATNRRVVAHLSPGPPR